MRTRTEYTVLLLTSPRLAPFRAIPGCAVLEVEGWDRLEEALRDAHAATVVLVDPYGAEADEPSDEFWRALERFPSVAFAAAFELVPARVAHLRAMLAAGASEAVNLRLDRTPELVARRIRDAFARPLKRRLEDVLSRFISVEGRTLLVAAAEVAAAGGGVLDLAAKFGVTTRTLLGWCARAGLPQPRRLLAWLRILLAAQILEDPGRTVGSAARACGYADERALRRVIQRFVGPESPGARSTRFFAAAADAFNAELRRCREERRQHATPPEKALLPMQSGDAVRVDVGETRGTA